MTRYRVRFVNSYGLCLGEDTLEGEGLREIAPTVWERVRKMERDLQSQAASETRELSLEDRINVLTHAGLPGSTVVAPLVLTPSGKVDADGTVHLIDELERLEGNSD